MKDIISEAISKKLSSTLETVGGAKALFGEAVTLNGEEIIPVARIRIELGAAADGSGSGDAGFGGLKSFSKGGGGGKADAGIQIAIEPAGYVKSTTNGPEFVAIRAN